MIQETFEYTTSIDLFSGDIPIGVSSPWHLEDLGYAIMTVQSCASTQYAQSIYVVAIDPDTGERTVLNDPDGDERSFSLELMRIERAMAEARTITSQPSDYPGTLFERQQNSTRANDDESSQQDSLIRRSRMTQPIKGSTNFRPGKP